MGKKERKKGPFFRATGPIHFSFTTQGPLHLLLLFFSLYLLPPPSSPIKQQNISPQAAAKPSRCLVGLLAAASGRYCHVWQCRANRVSKVPSKNIPHIPRNALLYTPENPPPPVLKITRSALRGAIPLSGQATVRE